MTAIGKRQRITRYIIASLQKSDNLTVDCVGTEDLYATIQSTVIAAQFLNRPPFDCNFDFVVKQFNGKEVTGFSINIRSKLESKNKIETPKRITTNAIMELEI